MTDDREEALFLAFRSQTVPDALIALLRGHQDHIFNICFQVLRHPQDAQDASQEILLEVTRGIGRIEHPRAFKTWLYRVSLHTALNHKKARTRHAELVRRKAAMQTSEAAMPPEEEKPAVIDALAHLDDESRCLVLEHYFDKATLEDLARRQGVSAVAIWKRIERAKEKLKRTLAGAGFAVAPTQVTRALESVSPVSAPAGLIGELVVSKAALVAGGGITVGAKSALSAITLVLAFLFLGLGLIGGLLIRRPPADSDLAKVRDLESKVAKLSADLAAARRPDSSGPAKSGPEIGTPATIPPGDSPNLAPAEQLKNRLARFKAWRRKANEDRKANSRREPEWFVDQWTSNEAAQRWRTGHLEQLDGLRSLIILAPEVFVDFVKDPANADCVSDLLQFTLGNPAPGSTGGWYSQKYADFPPELLDGLHGILLTGGGEVQLELLQLFNQIQEAPVQYLDRYRSLLTSAEPTIRAIAAKLLCCDRRARPEDLIGVQELALSPHYRMERSTFMEALTMSSLPESEAWFMTQMESTRDDELAGYLIRAMGRRAMFRLAQPDSLERVAGVIPRFLDRRQEDLTQWAILEVTAYLPSEKIPGILERFLASATNEGCRRAATRMAELLRDGERRALWLFQAVAEIQENPSRRR